MIDVFIRALVMLAFVHAVTKFVKYSQFCGSVITLVEAYSSGVLNAVIRQTTIGTTERKLANARSTYLATDISMPEILEVTGNRAVLLVIFCAPFPLMILAELPV